MKKSKMVSLVLITAVLASCNRPKRNAGSNFYMRSDTTAGYTRGHPGSTFMWYYAFRPYGSYYNGAYRHAGYYSSGIRESSNIGSSTFKGSIVRGGFGSSGGHSSSS